MLNRVELSPVDLSISFVTNDHAFIEASQSSEIAA